MRVILSLFYISVATVSALSRNANRILGGSPAYLEQYPFMSNMQRGFWEIHWSHACGGSLITSTAVLSAAHCYPGSPALSWRVRFSTALASDVGQEHVVSQIILHPEFNGLTYDNDIAMVKLAVPASFSNTVGVARIAGPNYILPDGTVVYAVGWGTRSTDGDAHPEHLRHVDQHIINQEICAQRYAHLKTLPGYEDWPDVTPNMLCNGILDVGFKAPCTGDSGGPIVHGGDIVVGIISWSYHCAEPFYPSVSVRVSAFTDWIVANA